ncbi:hypothetical protein GCM10007857_88710 [Bradyrhizobium iriomotense]|uniref:Uncharacterized protein n=1 Tax=Bradyrhizobium iriomotense TaxID=441950 RepID=A0ABQ6BHV0_9BRAD|nr:hypothetical protein GCM10007857_88710 [Bradyrhizobium iriomotense]
MNDYSFAVSLMSASYYSASRFKSDQPDMPVQSYIAAPDLEAQRTVLGKIEGLVLGEPANNLRTSTTADPRSRAALSVLSRAL